MGRLTSVPVYRLYGNTITVNLNYNVTGETLSCQGRATKASDSTLLVTFTVVVDDATSGQLTLTALPAAFTADAAEAQNGFLNIKRVSSGVPLPGTGAIPFLLEDLPTA